MMLRDGEWHTTEQVNNALNTGNTSEASYRRLDFATNQINNAGLNRGYGIATRSAADGTTEYRIEARPLPAPPPPPPPPPPRPAGPPNPDFRKAKGFLAKDDNPLPSDIRNVGINISSHDIAKFRQDFQMSPKDLKDLILKGLPEEYTRDARLTISSSGLDNWSVDTHTNAFDQSRSFTLGENPSVYHSSWSVNSEYYGKGIAKQVFDNQMDLYDHLGIKQVKVSAGLTVGGYAWARFGFTPDSDGWRSMGRETLRRAENLPANVKEQVKLITKIDDPKAIWLLAALKDDSGISIGKKLLLNRSWGGSINMNDRDQYSAVRAYTEHRRQSGLAAMGLDFASVFAKATEDDLEDLNGILKSKEGNKASDKLAVKFAVEQGWSPLQAIRWFGEKE